MKITGLSHLFKWENLHNWWLTKYFFAPLCVCVCVYIYIYIYIYILYVYVSNQIQQNKIQPEHVSEAERFNIPLCVCELRSVVHGQNKRSANDPLTGKPKITRSDHAFTLNVSSNVRPIYFFLFIVTLLNKCLN